MWTILTLAAVAGATAALAVDHARSWHYFADAAQLLFGEAGLALHRDHPELQFGPVVAVVAAPFAALPDPVEEWAVMTAGALAGVAVLGFAVDTARRWRPGRGAAVPDAVLLVAGLAFVAFWLRLAAYTTHVDDVMALASTAAAASATARGRPGWAALALGVAAASKPWAVVFVPLALVGGGRRVLRLALALAVPSLSWLPFLLAAPGTVEALGGFALEVDAGSGLRLLGVSATTAPAWVRPAQLVLGLAVTGAIALRGRCWPALPAAGVAARLLLDPALHHYYVVGFAAAALIWELSAFPRRWPWRTAAASAVLSLAATGVDLGGLVPAARFALLGAVLVAALGLSPRGRPSVP